MWFKNQAKRPFNVKYVHMWFRPILHSHALFLQNPSSISGTISPQGQIVVPASALQQGNVTVTAVNPTQVVAGMSSWHTTPPSGTVLLWLKLRFCHEPLGHLDQSMYSAAQQIILFWVCLFMLISGGTVYQPVTVVTPQGQVVTQALSPGTIRVQNNQVVHLSMWLWYLCVV